MSHAETLALILGNTNGEKALVRAAKLRILPACGRCLGSGQYSFNGTHSTCYGCNGSGARKPEGVAEWDQVLASANAAANDGRLSLYMAGIDAVKRVKGATDKVMAAWKAIAFDYKWQLAAAWHREPTEENKRHREISDINKKCADAFDTVMNIHLNPKSETYSADCIKAALTLDLALATVEAARCEYLLYLASNPKG